MVCAMNKRQLTLKNMIDAGIIPTVIDSTSIWKENEDDIPFHWGDIEVIGYGKTFREGDKDGDVIDVHRQYTGPNKINLEGTGEMSMGMWSKR